MRESDKGGESWSESKAEEKVLGRVLLICGIQDIRFHSRLYWSIIIRSSVGWVEFTVPYAVSTPQIKKLVDDKINI